MCARFLLYGICACARYGILWSVLVPARRAVGVLVRVGVGILGIGRVLILECWECGDFGVGILDDASVASGDLGFLLGWVFVGAGVCWGVDFGFVVRFV